MSSETRQTRRYSSALRTRQAAETRARILDAAAESFTTNGYGGTTLAAIAALAGVSVETVQANGPKRALLEAAFERAFTGDEGRHLIVEREVGKQILTSTDLDEFLARSIAFVTDANARTVGLWRAFLSAADSDPSIMAALDDMYVRRRADLQRFVAAMVDLGAPIRDPQRAADVVSFLVSPEGWEQLVIRSGWSREAYVAWLTSALRAVD